MKPSSFRIAAVGVALALGMRFSKPGSERIRIGPTTPAPVPRAANPRPTPPSAPAVPISSVPTGAPPALAAFVDWTVRFLKTEGSGRPALLGEGVQLAGQRRDALAQLIRSDPESVLRVAVPWAVRQQLPPEIQDLLEERVSGVGDLTLFAVAPLPGQTVEDPLSRRVVLHGVEYRAFTYGRRALLATLPGASIIGIAVGRDLAVSDSPLRVLEPGETATGREVDPTCPISGQVTTVADLGATRGVAVEANGMVQVLCCPSHMAAYERQLVAKETSGAANFQPHPLSTIVFGPAPEWTHGTKTLLLIRVDFPDFKGTPTNYDGTQLTEPYAANLINNPTNGVNAYFQQNSYGQSSLRLAPATNGDSPDVTPVLRMPRPAA